MISLRAIGVIVLLMMAGLLPSKAAEADLRAALAKFVTATSFPATEAVVRELAASGASSVEGALSALAATGMQPTTYAPPVHRLLWRMGFHVPPPHFAGFTSNLIFSGTWFGIVWGTIMWFATWSDRGMSPAGAIVAAIVAGILFGLCMAIYYRHGARKHNLPAWPLVHAHRDQADA